MVRLAHDQVTTYLLPVAVALFSDDFQEQFVSTPRLNAAVNLGVVLSLQLIERFEHTLPRGPLA